MAIRCGGAGRGILRGAGAAALLLGAALAASGAALGGGYWSAVGPGRAAIKRARLDPAPFLANLRFDFDGAPADLSGTGTVHAYDALGQALLADLPLTWTTGPGSAFRGSLLSPALAAHLDSILESATGRAVELSLEKADVKGALRLGATEIKAVVQVSGTATVDGGEPRPFKARMRVK